MILDNLEPECLRFVVSEICEALIDNDPMIGEDKHQDELRLHDFGMQLNNADGLLVELDGAMMKQRVINDQVGCEVSS